MIEIPPGVQAQLDQENARADQFLDRMVERYRQAVAAVGPELAVDLMEAVTNRAPWNQASLATLSTYALRRIVRMEDER